MDGAAEIDQFSRVSSHSVELNFGSLSIGDEAAANVTVGDRSIDFFHSPDNFPIYFDGQRINMVFSYSDDSEEMTVQRLENRGNIAVSNDVADAASLDVIDMTDYQKTVAFLYLCGEVMPNGG